MALVYWQLSVWEENQSAKAQRKIPLKWTFLYIAEHPEPWYFQERLYSECGHPACLRLVSAEPATARGGSLKAVLKSLGPDLPQNEWRSFGTGNLWYLRNRCAGFPQVGTSHVHRICAMLKSLLLVSSLPPESRAFIYLTIIFFPQDFLWELLDLFTSLSTRIIMNNNNTGGWAVRLWDTVLCGELIFKKLNLKTQLHADGSWEIHL